jgi:hypothetical protein
MTKKELEIELQDEMANLEWTEDKNNKQSKEDIEIIRQRVINLLEKLEGRIRT